MTSGLLWLVWCYAVREKLIRSISDAGVKTITKKLRLALAAYLVMILLGLFLPLAAVIGYLIIAVYNIVPLGAPRAARKAAAGCNDT